MRDRFGFPLEYKQASLIARVHGMLSDQFWRQIVI
jgi:hypothetical protein